MKGGMLEIEAVEGTHVGIYMFDVFTLNQMNVEETLHEQVTCDIFEERVDTVS